MNEKLEKMARQYLKDNLTKCTADQQSIFARMYGGFGFNANITTVVDRMAVEKLDWAMTQVDSTIVDNGEGE